MGVETNDAEWKRIKRFISTLPDDMRTYGSRGSYPQNELMRIVTVNLPTKVVDFLDSDAIRSLYPSRSEAIRAYVFWGIQRDFLFDKLVSE